MADFDNGPMPYNVSGDAFAQSNQHFADSAYNADQYVNYEALGTFPEDNAQPAYGGYSPPAAPTPQFSGGGPSGMDVANIGFKGAGMVAGLYGKEIERAEAKKRYDEQMVRWEQSEVDRKRRQAMEDARRKRQEGYFAGQYSQDVMENLSGAYGGFRTPGASGGR